MCGSEDWSLTVLPRKLLLMQVYPVMTPFWDQWDARSRGSVRPVQLCSLSWDAMFGLHNEHRVFFTRLLALDLLLRQRSVGSAARTGRQRRRCTR